MATVIVEKETVAGQDDVDSIDVGSLRVFAGLCCSTCSLYNTQYWLPRRIWKCVSYRMFQSWKMR